MFKNPLVSILIASYNKEKYVTRCINSCLGQTYKNIEIIFFDDASNDNSFIIAKKYKNIKSFKNKIKKKKIKFNTYYQISTYLKAYKKSKGEIITFLDVDDFYHKNKIYEIVKYFKKNPKSNIVYDKPILFFSKKKKYRYNIYVRKFNKFIWPKFPPQSCISIRRKLLKKYYNQLTQKRFSMLTLDFRLAAYSNNILKDFTILNKYLTFYFQDLSGESYSKFKKYSFNWWLRRKQAHKYMKYIYIKK